MNFSRTNRNAGVRFRAHCHSTTKQANKGFSLVEAMVSITIGLIILVALAQIFATSKATYRVEENMSRVQESGRFAFEFLSRDIRMAGYTGCLPKFAQGKGDLVNALNFATDDLQKYNVGDHVTGHRHNGGTGTNLSDWTPPLPGLVNGITYFANGQVVAGTDVLVLRRADESNIPLVAAMTTDTDVVKVSTTSGVTTNDIFVIANCKKAAIFQVTGFSDSAGVRSLLHAAGAATPGNSRADLGGPLFGLDAQLLRFNTRMYYIGRRGNVATNPPSLFVKEWDRTATLASRELVEGVEQMRVLYGIDTDQDVSKSANQYRTAQQVNANVPPQWPQVVSVRIVFLVRTNEDVETLDDPKVFTISGVSFAAAASDRKKRRQVFTMTIQVRNPNMNPT